MKEYEVEIEVCAAKTMIIKAKDEDDAANKALEYIDRDGIPITYEDFPEITITGIFDADDADEYKENVLSRRFNLY